MYLDTSSRVTHFSNQTFGHLTNMCISVKRSVRNIPPACLSDLRALSEKDDVPRRGRVGSPRLLQGSLSDYMPNVCAPAAGFARGSPAGALAVCPVLSRTALREQQRGRVPCNGAGGSPAVPIAPCGLTLPFAQSRARSGGQQDPPAPELPVAWPGAWAPGTWLVDLVALRAVLVDPGSASEPLVRLVPWYRATRVHSLVLAALF